MAARSKLNCKVAIKFVSDDGITTNCGVKKLKGKRDEFEMISKKIASTCSKSVNDFDIFWVKQDDSHLLISDQSGLQGTLCCI